MGAKGLEIAAVEIESPDSITSQEFVMLLKPIRQRDDSPEAYSSWPAVTIELVPASIAASSNVTSLEEAVGKNLRLDFGGQNDKDDHGSLHTEDASDGLLAGDSAALKQVHFVDHSSGAVTSEQQFVSIASQNDAMFDQRLLASIFAEIIQAFAKNASSLAHLPSSSLPRIYSHAASAVIEQLALSASLPADLKKALQEERHAVEQAVFEWAMNTDSGKVVVANGKGESRHLEPKDRQAKLDLFTSAFMHSH